MKKTIPIKEVIKTRQLLIYDEHDKLRMVVGDYTGVEPKISILKQDGTPALEISAGNENNSRKIAFFGDGLKWRALISVGDRGVGMEIYDKDENSCGTIGVMSNLKEKKVRPKKGKKD